jgi:hypothetical protein
MASKTERKNTRTKAKKTHDSSFEHDRIMPCNKGRHAYVIMLDSRTPLLDTSTTEFYDAVLEVGATELLATMPERFPGHAWESVCYNFQAYVDAIKSYLEAA